MYLRRLGFGSAVLFGLLLGTMNFNLQAGQSLGWVEKIKLEPWGVEAKAKLDTGALTSSMHAEDIERYTKNGEEWVRFTISLEDSETGEQTQQRIVRPLLREFTAIGAGGRDERSVVLMNVCIGDKIYEEQFSLRNRDNMIYPFLLGRRTIQHLGPVDVSSTFMTEANCDADSELVSFQEHVNDPDIGVD